MCFQNPYSDKKRCNLPSVWWTKKMSKIYKNTNTCHVSFSWLDFLALEDSSSMSQPFVVIGYSSGFSEFSLLSEVKSMLFGLGDFWGVDFLGMWHWMQCKHTGQDPILEASADLNLRTDPSFIWSIVTRCSSFSISREQPSIDCSLNIWNIGTATLIICTSYRAVL